MGILKFSSRTRVFKSNTRIHLADRLRLGVVKIRILISRVRYLADCEAEGKRKKKSLTHFLCYKSSLSMFKKSKCVECVEVVEFILLQRSASNSTNSSAEFIL